MALIPGELESETVEAVLAISAKRDCLSAAGSDAQGGRYQVRIDIAGVVGG